MLRYISFLVFLTFVNVSQAQPVTSVTYEVMIETAEMAVMNNDYSNAIEWYEEAYRESRDKDLAVKIAHLKYAMRDYEKAAKGYQRLLNRDKDLQFQDLRLDYGKALKRAGSFQEAYNELYAFTEYTEDEDMKKEALFEMEGIKKMGQFEQNIDAVIEFAGKKVNYGQAEYSPTYYNDGTLYYGAFGENKAIEIEENGPSAYVQIYTSIKDDEGKFKKGEALPEEINREGYHTSNVSFSKDGKRMFFTRSVLDGNIASQTQIYVSYRGDGGWSPAILLEGVNGEFISTHPAQGELFGNEVLFFTSDMDGGFGGMDIYYATKKGENSYSTPVNLGEKVNTMYDDVTPFYMDGTLYFSSAGWHGMGGLDIFYSTWDGVRWSDPANMGYGYNTSLDDHYLSFNSDGTKGFLVSNRVDKDKRRLTSKTCCDDVYTIEIREIVIDLLATVLDENGPLKGANVELIDLSAEEGTDSKSKSNLSGSDFNFLLDSDHKYKALVTREGYYPDSVDFNTFGILDDYTVKKKVTLKPIPVEPEVEIVTINQAIRLNNIYYDFDDDKILPDAEKDLSILLDLMNQYGDMVIELSSHTDAQGVSTYNQKLSQRRAESAAQWLVDKGVVADRIKPVGYGESVILNRCVNGVRCEDEEHRFNRRTEFKIIAGPETIEIKKEVIRGSNSEKKN